MTKHPPARYNGLMPGRQVKAIAAHYAANPLQPSETIAAMTGKGRR